MLLFFLQVSFKVELGLRYTDAQVIGMGFLAHGSQVWDIFARRWRNYV